MADEQLVTESQLDDATAVPQAAPSPQRMSVMGGVSQSMWSPADALRESTLRGRLDQTQQQSSALTDARIKEHGQHMAKQGPLLDDAKMAMNQMGNDIQAQRQQPATQMPQAPSGPVVDPEEFRKFFGPALIFSALLGKLAKADMGDGLNMLASSMQGFVMGSKEKAASQMEQWRAKTEQAVNTEMARHNKYKEIMESDQLNIQQKIDRLKIDAFAEEDKQMMYSLQEGRYDKAVQTYLKELQMIEKHKEAATKFYGQMQKAQQKMAASQFDPALIDAVGQGRVGINSISLRQNARADFEAAVLAKYPNWKDYTNKVQAKTEQDFTTGKQGQTVRSVNVALEHLDTLQQLSDALGNKDTQLLNRASIMWKKQTGEDAPTNFDGAKQIIAAEVIKVIVANGGGVTERQEASNNIMSASSPQQLSGMIRTYKQLFAGQLKGLQKQYESGTGAEGDFGKRLTEKSKGTFYKGKQAEPIEWNDLK